MRPLVRRLAIALPILALAGALLAWWAWSRLTTQYTPGELIRYAQKRLSGHNALEALASPVLRLAQQRWERTPGSRLPTLGKGQQVGPATDEPPVESVLPVADADALVAALRTATAGQFIEIAPGTYSLSRHLLTGQPGREGKPVTVRAAVAGSVTLDIRTEEGIIVSQPWWVFENLVLRGACAEDNQCEHAFHIVGKAAHTIIRNNRVEDFNAHVKVNGVVGDWPDHGLIASNTFTNTRPRNTAQPVTPVDIVGASAWRVADNLIQNFVKSSGDRISYGVFMKGGGRDGRIERNLIVCTPTHVSQPGSRVGLSFGGGGTGQGFCRDGRCVAEHTGGLASQNVIAHCNDFGIDVNRSWQVVLAYNTLVNTAGIDARNASGSVRIVGNLVEGRVRARDGSQLQATLNELGRLPDWLVAPDALDLRWRRLPEAIPAAEVLGDDFCHTRRQPVTLPGAFDGEPKCP